ncbi:MAG: PadR family transcriptional regulator [Cyclobacteriaceae bacterium]|nr:PadR family transcriptional regulator [Cyclobacteriaceae bacterium HetDA_MAG_MS6]
MKETGLGEFEEVILLLVGILGQEAYAFKLAEEFEAQTKRSVSIGAVHSTLSRLDDKGFLTSEMGQATASRGGRRKRIYTITASGERALQAAKDFRVSLWRRYPTLGTSDLPMLALPTD